jgi:hypothetical protein
MTEPPKGHGYIDFVDGEEHFWKIETLWEAARGRSIRAIPLEEIPWKDDGCHILGLPPNWGAFAEHCRRAMSADLSFPVILGPTGDVMDGMHRIVRAYVEGKETVAGVVLENVPAPDRIRPLESERADIMEEQ